MVISFLLLQFYTTLIYRLDSLKEVHRRHQLDQDRLEQELGQTIKELDDGEIRAPQLAQRFRYYQELRGYVTDLVECLDEKVGLYAVTFFYVHWGFPCNCWLCKLLSRVRSHAFFLRKLCTCVAFFYDGRYCLLS